MTLSSDVLCDFAGVTYRQLDYLTRTTSLVRTMIVGSGHRRRWPLDVAKRLAVAGALRDGIDFASPTARDAAVVPWRPIAVACLDLANEPPPAGYAVLLPPGSVVYGPEPEFLLAAMAGNRAGSMLVTWYDLGNRASALVSRYSSMSEVARPVWHAAEAESLRAALVDETDRVTA